MTNIKWTDVNKEQPKHKEDVLICFNNSDYYVAYFDEYEKCFNTHTQGGPYTFWIKKGNPLSWVSLTPPSEDDL